MSIRIFRTIIKSYIIANKMQERRSNRDKCLMSQTNSHLNLALRDSRTMGIPLKHRSSECLGEGVRRLLPSPWLNPKRVLPSPTLSLMKAVFGSQYNSSKNTFQNALPFSILIFCRYEVVLCSRGISSS